MRRSFALVLVSNEGCQTYFPNAIDLSSLVPTPEAKLGPASVSPHK